MSWELDRVKREAIGVVSLMLLCFSICSDCDVSSEENMAHVSEVRVPGNKVYLGPGQYKAEKGCIYTLAMSYALDKKTPRVGRVG